MMETNGIGVDIVLNSLHNEIRLASVKCLATGGRFLELSKFDLSNNVMIGGVNTYIFKMYYFDKN